MRRDHRRKVRAPSVLQAPGVRGVVPSLRMSVFLVRLARINLLLVRPTVLCAFAANLGSTVLWQVLLPVCAAHQGLGPKASSRPPAMCAQEDSGPSLKVRCTALIAHLVMAADFASVEPLPGSLWRC